MPRPAKIQSVIFLVKFFLLLTLIFGCLFFVTGCQPAVTEVWPVPNYTPNENDSIEDDIIYYMESGYTHTQAEHMVGSTKEK